MGQGDHQPDPRLRRSVHKHGKVFLTEHIHPDAVAYLRENFEVVQGTSTESGEIIRQAQGCSAILIRSAKITAEIMDAIPTLKVVAKHGMGVDNIAVDHATERGSWWSTPPTPT